MLVVELRGGGAEGTVSGAAEKLFCGYIYIYIIAYCYFSTMQQKHFFEFFCVVFIASKIGTRKSGCLFGFARLYTLYIACDRQIGIYIIYIRVDIYTVAGRKKSRQ